MRVVVAVCTYNRASRLARLLDSLAAMEVPEVLAWSLVVVDNNSADDTRAVAESFAGRLPLKYLFESEQGLSAARNRAILASSTASHVLFTDDDVVIDRRWLVAYVDAFEMFPTVGYFGGKILPFYPEGRPTWLHDESLALIDGLLVRFDRGDDVRTFTTQDPTPFGASFALSRACIDQVGKFRCDLGVVGGVPGRGEETDYMERAKTLGFAGVYVGTALVRHETDPNRLTVEYMFRYGVQSGIALRRGSDAAPRGTAIRACAFLVRGLWQLLRGRGDRFRQCVINAGVQRGLQSR